MEVRRSASERRGAATAAQEQLERDDDESGAAAARSNDEESGDAQAEENDAAIAAEWHRAIEFWLDADRHREPELCRSTALWLLSGRMSLDVASLERAGYTVRRRGERIVSIDCCGVAEEANTL